MFLFSVWDTLWLAVCLSVCHSVSVLSHSVRQPKYYNFWVAGLLARSGYLLVSKMGKADVTVRSRTSTKKAVVQQCLFIRKRGCDQKILI